MRPNGRPGSQAGRNEGDHAADRGPWWRDFVQHFAAQDVERHEFRRELDAAGVEPEHDAHGLDQLGLGEAGKADRRS